MKINILITVIYLIGSNAAPNIFFCKCPMLKQVDAELYATLRGFSGMQTEQIPNFAPLRIDYGSNCTFVTITCLYPRFTRHRSSVYYQNGANFSTVRRNDLADKYNIRCNQQTGAWLSDENSEISYIQCAYRPMFVNKLVSGLWEDLVRFCKSTVNILKTNFSFLKFIVGYE